MGDNWRIRWTADICSRKMSWIQFPPTWTNIDLHNTVKQKVSKKIRLSLNVENIRIFLKLRDRFGAAICN